MTSYFDTTYVRTKDLLQFFCNVFYLPDMKQHRPVRARSYSELPGLCLNDEQRKRLRRAGIAYHSRVHNPCACTLDIHVWTPGMDEEAVAQVNGVDVGHVVTPPDIAGAMLEFDRYTNEARRLATLKETPA